MKTLRAIKEVFISSLPLATVIIVVCGFIAPMQDISNYFKLAIGYIGVIIGQALFLVGLDDSILPIGKYVGSSLVKIKKATIIIVFGLLFGTLATVAEPALAVLARQTHLIINDVSESLFIWLMGAGIGVFVGFAMFRIMKDLNIKIIFAIFYILTFAIVIFVPKEFVPLAFDGSGATTGDVSVPFILALGMGVSATMSKSKTNDDVFGIIGLASIGPILALFLYGIIIKATNGGVMPAVGSYEPEANDAIMQIILNNAWGCFLALIPIIIVFIPFQLLLIKLPRKEFLKMLFTTITVYLGLLIFLCGIDYGFAFAGKYIGEVFLNPARPDWFKWILLLVGFILGMSITLSEPAVTVLGEQLETITNGHIKKLSIRMTLAIAIGFAALLSMIKILTQIDILWFLVPLYIIAIVMMKFSSKLFVGLAFDSGGVSGGALTSAFLTPLTLGVAQAVSAANGLSISDTILTNGFGIIAFISVTPLITVQALGIIYDLKVRKLKKAMELQELQELSALALQADSHQKPLEEKVEKVASSTNSANANTSTNNAEAKSSTATNASVVKNDSKATNASAVKNSKATSSKAKTTAGKVNSSKAKTTAGKANSSTAKTSNATTANKAKTSNANAKSSTATNASAVKNSKATSSKAKTTADKVNSSKAKTTAGKANSSTAKTSNATTANKAKTSNANAKSSTAGKGAKENSPNKNKGVEEINE